MTGTLARWRITISSTLPEPVPIHLDRLARQLAEIKNEDWTFGAPRTQITARPTYVHYQAGGNTYRITQDEATGLTGVWLDVDKPAEYVALAVTPRAAIRAIAEHFYTTMIALVRNDWPLIGKAQP